MKELGNFEMYKAFTLVIVLAVIIIMSILILGQLELINIQRNKNVLLKQQIIKEVSSFNMTVN